MATGRIRIKFRGDVGKSIRTKHVQAEEDAEKFAKAVAEEIADEARRRVHVITGHMKGSIKAYPLGNGRWRVVVEDEAGRYEEFGTRYRPGHPFFTPAVLNAMTRLRAIAEKELKP